MKLLLTPKGLSDFVVGRIPRVTGLIPRKQHVIVLLCNDGKDTAARTDMTPGKLAYFTRLLTKLCMLNNDVVNTVAVTEISFFEPAHTFHQKLSNAEFFFMAGLTNKVDHVEGIFRRDDPHHVYEACGCGKSSCHKYHVAVGHMWQCNILWRHLVLWLVSKNNATFFTPDAGDVGRWVCRLCKFLRSRSHSDVADWASCIVDIPIC